MSSMAATKRQYIGVVAAVLLEALLFSTCVVAQTCGSQAGGAKCASSLCCSKHGFCGSTRDYCGEGCQSGPCSSSPPGPSGGGGCNPACASNQCCSQYGFCGSTDDYCGPGCQSGPCIPPPPPPPHYDGNVSSIITTAIFDHFLPSRHSAPANGFYTYAAFLRAAAAFNGFGTAGTSQVQKRELAAFFANIAHETGSGQYVEEINKATYCDTTYIPCAPGQQYYGRGPIQLSWNYNYKPAGDAIGFDGINNPGIVASDPAISFETAIWFWMVRSLPTCHVAMLNGNGFGATIKAINGGLECGTHPVNPAAQQHRVQLYLSYCATLDVDPGSNLYC